MPQRTVCETTRLSKLPMRSSKVCASKNGALSISVSIFCSNSAKKININRDSDRFSKTGEALRLGDKSGEAAEVSKIEPSPLLRKGDEPPSGGRGVLGHLRKACNMSVGGPGR